MPQDQTESDGIVPFVGVGQGRPVSRYSVFKCAAGGLLPYPAWTRSSVTNVTIRLVDCRQLSSIVASFSLFRVVSRKGRKDGFVGDVWCVMYAIALEAGFGLVSRKGAKVAGADSVGSFSQIHARTLCKHRFRFEPGMSQNDAK